MLHTEFVKIASENYEANKAKEKAIAYIKANRKANTEKALITITVSMLIAIAMFAIVLLFIPEKEYTYAASNGNNGYEWYKDAIVDIVSVDLDTNIVTVEYKGNEYSYYANGEISVGKVIVTFDESMRIINAN